MPAPPGSTCRAARRRTACRPRPPPTPPASLATTTSHGREPSRRRRRPLSARRKMPPSSATRADRERAPNPVRSAGRDSPSCPTCRRAGRAPRQPTAARVRLPRRRGLRKAAARCRRVRHAPDRARRSHALGEAGEAAFCIVSRISRPLRTRRSAVRESLGGAARRARRPRSKAARTAPSMAPTTATRISIKLPPGCSKLRPGIAHSNRPGRSPAANARMMPRSSRISRNPSPANPARTPGRPKFT